MMKLEITDQRILQFYENNPQVNFQSVNLLFIDLFEKLLINGAESIVQSQMNLFQKEYVADIQKIVQSNTHDQIAPLLEKNNCFLMEKTTNLLHEILPNTNSQIKSALQSFAATINSDTQQLLKSSDQQSIKDFINNFEIKSSMMMQPIYSYISASEERTNTNIKDGQTKFMCELTDSLNKFKDYQTSPPVIDKQLANVLTKLYSSSEVQTKRSDGLIVLKRQGRPNIIIENRDIETNVTSDEVQSFTLSVDDHNCNGIFISHKSGISTKKNYQIEIHNNNVLVYLHQAQYSSARIEAAIDIIDQLSTKMRQFKHSGGDDCTVPKDIMDTINNEYQLFLSQKNAVIEVFKESQKKVLAQVDEIRFPTLDKFLSTKYSAPIQKPGLKCDLCKSFSANNLKALAAHKRGCIRKAGIKPCEPVLKNNTLNNGIMSIPIVSPVVSP
jgi:hypothetical protein